MAYQKKADRTPAEQVQPTQVPSAAAYSIVRGEGGYWQFIKWDITSDGVASVVEISNPDLFPIIADKVDRFFLKDAQ